MGPVLSPIAAALFAQVYGKFFLPFADLGNGQVDTTAVKGGVTPTFTRAGATATTVGSNGLILRAIGANVPRSYYDPTTLVYRGYLPEGARTNLFLSSEDLRSAAAGNPVTAWTNTDTTVTANAASAPDGNTTASLLTEGSAGTASVFQDVTGTANANFAVSMFFKYGNAQWVRIAVANGGNGFNAWFDVQNGVLGATSASGTGAVVSSRITQYPNGWYRCTVVGSIGSGATAIRVQNFNVSANGGGTRVNGATRYAWGTQFENNVSLSSTYIPTTTAAVVRNADILTYPTTGWLNANAGTLIVSARTATDSSPISAIQTPVALDDGTNNERMAIRRDTDGVVRFLVVDGGVVQANIGNTTPSASSVLKVAAAYSANDFAISVNGGTVVTDTSGTLPTVTQMTVGERNNAEFQFSPDFFIAYAPVRLPNWMLQALTA